KIISAEEVIQLSPTERLKIFLSRSDEEYLQISPDYIIELAAVLNRSGVNEWLKLVRRYEGFVSKKDNSSSDHALKILVYIYNALFELLKEHIKIDIVVTDDISETSIRDKLLSKWFKTRFPESDAERNNEYISKIAKLKQTSFYTDNASFVLNDNFEAGLEKLNAFHLAAFISKIPDQKGIVDKLLSKHNAENEKTILILRQLAIPKQELINIILEHQDERFAIDIVKDLDLSDDDLSYLFNTLISNNKLNFLQQFSSELLKERSVVISRVLKNLLSLTKEANMQRSIIKIASNLKIQNFQDVVFSILNSTNDEKLMLSSLAYLNNNPHDGSFDKLKEMIQKRTGFFKMRYYYSSDIRSRALLCISKLAQEEVKDIIISSLKDKSSEVQAAATVAYNELVK
ncbi:MAG: hypothetical protein HY606_04940, partial [Planctomycetes bacterium]|nr:hypothetical protein [Planctomycetota bacterium]